MHNTLNNILRFVSFMLILTTFLPIVTGNLPRYITGYNLWAPIWLLSVLVFGFKTLRNSSVLFLIIYGIINLLLFNTIWSDISDWDQRGMFGELFDLIVPITAVSYFFMVKDYKWLGKIGWIAAIFILITAIFTIRASYVMPGYARMYALLQQGEVETLKGLGGGWYGYAGLLICFIPVLVYYLKFNQLIGISKAFMVFALLICFYALIQLQIFANILLAVIVILVSIAGRSRVKTSLIPLSLIAITLILIPDKIYGQFFFEMSFYFEPESDIYGKLQDFAHYIEYGEAYESGAGIAGRAGRYPVMLELFLSSPIFGYSIYQPNANTMGGGHLYWINKLAVFGLIGFVPFVIFYYKHFRKQLEEFGEQYRFYFLVSVLSIVALGFMKVIGGREMWTGLVFVIPAMYYMPMVIKRGDPLMKQKHFEIH
jgi:hypothetical protein